MKAVDTCEENAKKQQINVAKMYKSSTFIRQAVCMGSKKWKIADIFTEESPMANHGQLTR